MALSKAPLHQLRMNLIKSPQEESCTIVCCAGLPGRPLAMQVFVEELRSRSRREFPQVLHPIWEGSKHRFTHDHHSISKTYVIGGCRSTQEITIWHILGKDSSSTHDVGQRHVVKEIHHARKPPECLARPMSTNKRVDLSLPRDCAKKLHKTELLLTPPLATILPSETWLCFPTQHACILLTLSPAFRSRM